MKRYGYIWQKLVSLENTKSAIWNASLHKRQRKSVSVHLTEDAFERDAMQLSQLVDSGLFRPSPPHHMIINDGSRKKQRDIYVPKFWPDQCVHWMLMLQIAPLILKSTYKYSCGSIPGRGVEYALTHVMRWLETDPKKCVWCLQLDIAKFYQHIDHDVLKEKFVKKIKDARVLGLLNSIIDSHAQGVPIGFYTSQWFANFYLNDFDHYVKQELQVPHYVRFADDMLLFGSNKRELLRALEAIKNELKKIGLSIKEAQVSGKPAWQIFRPRDTPIHFLGRKIRAIRVSESAYRYKWVCTLDGANRRRITKRARKIAAKGYMDETEAAQAVSDYGRARFGNNWMFERDNMRPRVDFDKARKLVSQAAKRRKHLPTMDKQEVKEDYERGIKRRDAVDTDRAQRDGRVDSCASTDRDNAGDA